eukprot:TRINITY_DN62876_c0_g1_i1.p1 TRINITY_DN62876_c0_g1~~TRINITY_DN62876_c0_g1_i1.p1  ORF type:complete len:369 (+),score=57.63 TRINITY_DN62876_c0_g1_i1:87-1193(+)
MGSAEELHTKVSNLVAFLGGSSGGVNGGSSNPVASQPSSTRRERRQRFRDEHREQKDRREHRDHGERNRDRERDRHRERKRDRDRDVDRDHDRGRDRDRERRHRARVRSSDAASSSVGTSSTSIVYGTCTLQSNGTSFHPVHTYTPLDQCDIRGYGNQIDGSQPMFGCVPPRSQRSPVVPSDARQDQRGSSRSPSVRHSGKKRRGVDESVIGVTKNFRSPDPSAKLSRQRPQFPRGPQQKPTQSAEKSLHTQARPFAARLEPGNRIAKPSLSSPSARSASQGELDELEENREKLSEEHGDEELEESEKEDEATGHADVVCSGTVIDGCGDIDNSDIINKGGDDIVEDEPGADCFGELGELGAAWTLLL